MRRLFLLSLLLLSCDFDQKSYQQHQRQQIIDQIKLESFEIDYPDAGMKCIAHYNGYNYDVALSCVKAN